MVSTLKVNSLKVAESLLRSYSMVFFSDNKLFAFILLAVSLFDPMTGISGFIAALLANLMAWLMGFNEQKILSGLYGFNALLVGLGFGVYFQPNAEFWFLLLFASILTLFITIAIEGWLTKYGLPFLTFPFLIGIWMLLLASRFYTGLDISERSIYALNNMYFIGGKSLVQVYNWINELPIHEAILIYFRSLGAIFFQNHLFAGLIISIGLLIYSRQAFLLSLIGYFSAYYFYIIVGANIQELTYNYIGFNYILTAIAIGGFFLITNTYSYLWVLLLTPLNSIIISSSSIILAQYQLPIYSLSFNVIVVMFLFILKFRERHLDKPEWVIIQKYSPERNFYFQSSNKDRFHNFIYKPFSLPFFGEWMITQAHNGKHTHKDLWKHAWDFEVHDAEGKAFKNEGKLCEDYHCFNKPVIAVADGWIEELIDHIPDNEIGKINLKQNWGNTIVIKHVEGLYSKISHLKSGSIKVYKGQFVSKGDVLAHCGNSGRSPEPHLHFQIQATPYIGSATLDYPLGFYLKNNNKQQELHSFDRPKLFDSVSNIKLNKNIEKALQFIPGQILSYKTLNRNEQTVVWEVRSDSFKNTYIYCEKTNSFAWFRNESDLMYFTHFEGDRSSALFYFYMGLYKVIYGFTKGMVIQDQFPLNIIGNTFSKFLQDFIAPFYRFIKADYQLEYEDAKENMFSSSIKLKSSVAIKIGKRTHKKVEYFMNLKDGVIESIDITEGSKHWTMEYLRQD
ncbi:MAG: urea transporter [Bacteroidales bacterium]|nr:urea transporter [Bacteroidales bacterium]